LKFIIDDDDNDDEDGSRPSFGDISDIHFLELIHSTAEGLKMVCVEHFGDSL